MREDGDAQKEQLRQVAAKAVQLVEPSCRSRMQAYAKVAAAVGFSASYLRKFITVDWTPEPRWSAGVALIRYYENLCDALEADIEDQRRDIARITGALNAVDPSSNYIPSFLPHSPGSQACSED